MQEQLEPRCHSPRGLVQPVRVDPAGVRGPTPKAARGPKWRRVGPGWYVGAETRRSPEQRAVEAAVRLSVGGAVTGWGACRLHGAAFHDGIASDGRTELPVPLLMGGGNIRPWNGSRLLRHELEDAEIVVRAGVPCTTPERATYDAIWLADDLRGAVRALDMACAGEITSLSRMRRYVSARRTCSRLVKAALSLGSERSRSPAETDLRLVWLLDAGLPPPLENWPVLGRDGRLIGVPDLLDPETGLVVEYDGAVHRGRARHARDVEREAGFRDAGCELTRVVGPQLADRPAIARRLRSAQERADSTPPGRRRWRLGNPGPTLDERLEEREVRAALHEHWAVNPPEVPA